MRFFFDRNIAPKIADLVKGQGYEALHHDELFNQHTQDDEIIRYVVDNNLVLVTSDGRIKTVYRDLLVDQRPRIVFLSPRIHEMRLTEKGQWFIDNWAEVYRKCENYGSTWLLTISRSVEVTEWEARPKKTPLKSGQAPSPTAPDAPPETTE